MNELFANTEAMCYANHKPMDANDWIDRISNVTCETLLNKWLFGPGCTNAHAEGQDAYQNKKWQNNQRSRGMCLMFLAIGAQARKYLLMQQGSNC